MKAIKTIFVIIGIPLLVFIIFIFSLGYMFSGGTHGSIKGYQYPVSKERLEEAIQHVILENKTLERPPEDTVVYVDKDYYNHDGYLRLSIIAPDTFHYIIRFYGDQQYWKQNTHASEIFICYANDNLGNGGSEGLGGVEWYKWGIKDKLTDYFEKNFIEKLDKKLGVKHEEKD